jgi:hypothetical protein
MNSRWPIVCLSLALVAGCDNSDHKDHNKPAPQSQPVPATAPAPATTPAPATKATGASGDAAPKPGYLPAAKSAGAANMAEAELAPIQLDLPKALVVGTPKEAKGVNLDLKTLGKKRGPFIVPKGVELISKDKPVKLSDAEPAMGEAAMVTDGSREGTDGNWVEMTFGPQWAQVDLGKSSELWAIIVWHYFMEPRVYRDVIVQVSDDPEFKTGVTTLFNNDIDNSAKQGAGTDYEYFESEEGKLIDAKGIKARYVRCWNHVIEISVYGKK